ncbi:MAG: septal ring lytic transglycosylase RlpA family protein [Methyloceanibacter sp.]
MFTVRAKMIAVGLLGAAAIVPLDFAKADQRGSASWYSLPGNKTANGETMNPNELTAAHRSLPFGTQVLVENLSNGQSVVVRINDRGPFVGGRIIDLSKAAAASIGMIGSGVANVRVTVAGGGALAELGGTTAKAKAPPRIKNDRVAVAQNDAAPAASAKMAAADVEPVKTAAKPSGKAKVAAKPAKSRTLVVASASAKKRPASPTVKVAVAKRSRPSEDAHGRVQRSAAQLGIRAAGGEASKLSRRLVIAASAGPAEGKRAASGPSSRRTLVASSGPREAGREASRLASRRVSVAANTPHPYPVLGATPGFIKPPRTRERTATG